MNRTAGGRWQSVKGSVLLLVAVGLVPAVAGMAWHLEEQREEALRQAYSRAELLNNAISANLGRVLTDAKAVMSTIAARPTVRTLKSGDCDPVFRDFGTVYPNYTLLVLIRADGRTVCPELGGKTPPAEKMKRHPMFRAGVAHQGFYAGDIVLAPASARWVAPLMYPVKDYKGQLRGILVLPLDLEKLANQLFSSLPRNDFACVVDGSDQILLRSSQLSKGIGKRVAGPFVQMLAKLKADELAKPADTGAVQKFSAQAGDGVARLYFARPLPMTDWSVITGVPEQESLKDYVTLRNRSVAAMALVLALAALIGWRVARRVIRPLNDLGLAAKSIAAGNDGYRASESGPAELSVVAHEFNRMLDAQHSAQRQLRQNEAHYRTLLEQLPVGVIVRSQDGSVDFVNHHALAILRVTPEDLSKALVERQDWYLVDEQGQRLAARGYPSGLVSAGTGPISAQTIGIVREREGATPYAWVLVNAYPRMDADGRLTQTVLVFIDVTAQRNAEELRVAKEAAEAANRAKSQFLSQMSHELRTPLNAVLGFSQILQMDQRLPDEAQKRVGHVLVAGRHLLSLVDELLDLARIESGNLALSLEPVDLDTLLRKCLTLCEPQASSKSVLLSSALDDAGAGHLAGRWVRADRTRLQQVLMNLLSNAIKYNRPGGSVTLRVEQAPDGASDGEVRVTVIDTGPGMTAQQIAKLFEPFNRLGAEFSGVEGHGIGLVISRLLAHAMGGDIRVRGEPGKGCEFTLLLRACAPGPMAEAGSDQAESARPALASKIEAGNDTPRKLRVLSVEDNPVNQLVLQEIVALRSNLELVTAEDGASALELARTKHPDLMLLDLHLPDMDGFELLRRLRSNATTATTPCWAVTADAMPETVARVHAAGFDAYLSKPFAAEKFLGHIDRWADQVEVVRERS